MPGNPIQELPVFLWLRGWIFILNANPHLRLHSRIP